MYAEHDEGGDEEDMEFADKLVRQDYPIKTLDGVTVWAKTRPDLYKRMMDLQGVLRVTGADKRNFLVRDMVLRGRELYAMLVAKIHEPTGSTVTDGFEDLDQLHEVWDTPIFATEQTFTNFYLMIGWAKNDYSALSLRNFLKKGENPEWGREHTRSGKSYLVKALQRVEIIFKILYDLSFSTALRPMTEELERAEYASHCDGFLRYHAEALVCHWALSVRNEHAPDRAGFGHLAMTTPEDCAFLLASYARDYMRRLGAGRYKDAEGLGAMYAKPPHRNFFEAEGPWEMVKGKNQGKGGDADKVGKGGDGPANGSVCLDWLAGEYGVIVGQKKTQWACMRTTCPYKHTGTKAEAWKRVTEATWHKWQAAASTKAILSKILGTEFDPSWD